VITAEHDGWTVHAHLRGSTVYVDTITTPDGVTSRHTGATLSEVMDLLPLRLWTQLRAQAGVRQ
jgi:hypothetical protein